MCDAPSSAFSRARLGRRAVVSAGAAGLVFSSAVGRAAAADGPKGRKRAYVLVIDGTRPEEITAELTPTLLALRDGGANFSNAWSMPVMETIPNHVMMMTGLRPDRNGVPANVVWDRELGEPRTLDRRKDLKSSTLIGRLNRAGFTTGTVLSKEYL